MSRIWDALRVAEQEKAGTVINGGPLGERDGTGEWRADKPPPVSVPVSVYGHDRDSGPFYEETQASMVDGTAGILRMTATAWQGQKLLLTNQLSLEERICVVTQVGPKREGMPAIAFKFTQTGADFWQGNCVHVDA